MSDSNPPDGGNPLSKPTTRREALATIGTVTAAAGTLSISGMAQAASCEFGESQWMSRLGQSFRVIDDQQRLRCTMQLEEVVATPPGSNPVSSDVRKSGVTLVFAAGRDLEEGNYTLQNSEMGSQTLFVHRTCRGRHAEKTRFQVVIH